jgi:hypothetical protein
VRVLFDLTHPAQVHFFKHPIRELAEQGEEVVVTSRDKDVEGSVLDALGIPHRCLSRSRRGLLGLGLELVLRNARMIGLVRRLRPDVLVARMGISIGAPGALFGIPRVVFEDTEHARLQAALSLPLATHIVTGTGYRRDFGRRQVRFRGFPVLAYLAPDRFRPDPGVLRASGLDPDAPLVVLRTVAWEAAHDIGIEGSSADELRGAVERLGRFGRVVLSAEGELPEDLRGLANPVPVEQIHHLLAFARLVIGEGGTMAAEAAVLGTPAVFANPLRTGYLEALAERYGLVALTDRLADGLAVAEAWLADEGLAERAAAARRRLLADSEDVVAFMLRTIRGAARGVGA